MVALIYRWWTRTEASSRRKNATERRFAARSRTHYLEITIRHSSYSNRTAIDCWRAQNIKSARGKEREGGRRSRIWRTTRLLASSPLSQPDSFPDKDDRQHSCSLRNSPVYLPRSYAITLPASYRRPRPGIKTRLLLSLFSLLFEEMNYMGWAPGSRSGLVAESSIWRPLTPTESTWIKEQKLFRHNIIR